MRTMRARSLAVIVLGCARDLLRLLAGQALGKTHRLGATPQTVAYGHLRRRGAAGPDDRLGRHHRRRHAADQRARTVSSAPAFLRRQVQDSLRRDRGRGAGESPWTWRPHPHRAGLRRGAEPGDALEVSVLSISLPIAYGYNGCSGFRAATTASRGRQALIIPLDRQDG